jgi:hypothetical protein
VRPLSQNVASLRLCQRLGFTLPADVPPVVEPEWRALGCFDRRAHDATGRITGLQSMPVGSKA